VSCPRRRSRVTQSRKSFSVPLDFFFLIPILFLPFFAPRRTSCQSQNHLVNYTCIRVRACGLMRTLFIYVHIMRRLCTEILSSIFFLPLFLSCPKHFSAPLSRTRQSDLRPAGRFAEYLSRRLVMHWKRSKTAVASHSTSISSPP